MNKGLQAALALFLAAGGVWLFADTIIWSREQSDLLKRAAVRETLIEVGQTEGCTARVSLEVWAEINRLEVYRWVVACEDARK